MMTAGEGGRVLNLRCQGGDDDDDDDDDDIDGADDNNGADDTLADVVGDDDNDDNAADNSDDDDNFPLPMPSETTGDDGGGNESHRANSSEVDQMLALLTVGDSGSASASASASAVALSKMRAGGLTPVVRKTAAADCSTDCAIAVADDATSRLRRSSSAMSNAAMSLSSGSVGKHVDHRDDDDKGDDEDTDGDENDDDLDDDDGSRHESPAAAAAASACGPPTTKECSNFTGCSRMTCVANSKESSAICSPCAGRSSPASHTRTEICSIAIASSTRPQNRRTMSFGTQAPVSMKM